MKVPWLSKRRIAAEATALFERYRCRTGRSQPPIEVEKIIEKDLGLSLGYVDLDRRLGTRGVLGAIFVDRRLILIDERLLDEGQEGRLSFTCAHEIGHWALHRDLAATGHPRTSAPRILCRESDADLPLEWQANYFASCLLMPEDPLRKTFERLYGDSPLKIYNYESAYCGPLGFDPCVVNWPLIAEAAIETGRFTNVSRQAMIIRLQQLGMIENLSGVGMNWDGLDA